MEALDGNALGGPLYAAFSQEMTSARGTCGSCGQENALAELHVYLRAPGAVARCPACGEVQLVLIEHRGLACIDLTGLAALSVL
jgi:hypothetical protein